MISQDERHPSIDGYDDPAIYLFLLHYDMYEEASRSLFKWSRLPSPNNYYFCHTGLSKEIFLKRLHIDSSTYSSFFYQYVHPQLDSLLLTHHYHGVNYFICDSTKQFAIVFSPKEGCLISPLALAEEIDSLVQRAYMHYFSMSIEPYTNTTALSDKLDGYVGIHSGFMQTSHLKHMSFFHMKSGVLTRERLEELKSHTDYGHVMNTCRRLIAAVSHGHTEQCVTTCRYLFLHLLKYSFDTDLVRDVLSFLKNTCTMRAIVYGVADTDYTTLCSLEAYITVEECHAAIAHHLIQLCEAAKHVGTYSDAVVAALYYIHVNLAKPMSLSDIAEYVDLAPNRLSSLFHQETGLTFKQYQTQVRISRAKVLLVSSEMRISDIAAQCGFIDKRYFTELFKEHTGTTPQEYRNQRSRKPE